MTAKELIAALQRMPEDTMVVIPGYESGYDELSYISGCAVPITANHEKGWYAGKWVLAKRGTKKYAILLGHGR
jgi:hypothetical protein